MQIEELLLENIRCLAGTSVFDLKPITLLVGENSTGKTTVLAALSVIVKGLDLMLFGSEFNTPPFLLGGFSDIVSYPSKQYGRAQTFSLGVSTARMRIVTTYRSENDRPALSSVVCHTPKLLWILTVSESGGTTGSFFTDPKAERFAYSLSELHDSESLALGDEQRFDLALPRAMTKDLRLMVLLMMSLPSTAVTDEENGSSLFFQGLTRGEVSHIAPIRAVPRRTYESYQEGASEGPEGGHAPFVIERESREAPSSALIASLRDFGKRSGMFNRITVRRFGAPRGSRFAINVGIARGPVRNITDVGYGVSQVLPQIVESVKSPPGSVITIQQPEVHLHPKAQAALASLLARLATEENKQFFIETHSDYVVNRFRREVASGNIPSEDLGILFFDYAHERCSVSSIGIDRDGGLLEAPPEYRQFFLQETRAFLKGE